MTKVLTPARRARLEKLATYLEGLPADYRHFSMLTYYRTDDAKRSEVDYATHNGGVASCGTVACAVGHGPAAGILAPDEFIFGGGGGVDWNGYSGLFVGSPRTRHYDWAFHDAWAAFDSHHWGAAARIRYMLARGGPPRSFQHQTQIGARYLKLYAPYRIDAKAPTHA